MRDDECKKEFQVKNFGLDHDSPRIFLEPQCGRTRIAFCVYRLVVALYFDAVFVYDLITNEHEHGVYWPIFLTNWCLTLLTFTVNYDCVCVIVHYAKARNLPKDATMYSTMPVWIKISWVLNNMVMTSALLVTILYWGLLYDGTDILYTNFNAHAVNSAYVLINMFVVGSPVRMFHFVHGVIFGILYAAFTVIYWVAGGINSKGQPYIYDLMDYGGQPLTASLMSLGLVFLAMPILHFIFYGMYRLRLLLYGACCGRAKVDALQDWY